MSNHKSTKKLPTRIEDFNELHIRVLERLDKYPESKPFTGYVSREIDIPHFILILQELGLIDWAYYNEALQYTNNNTLKSILREFGLKVSGNKKDLIDRITSNISEPEVRNCKFYSDYYVLTQKGKEAIESSYARFEAEKLAFFGKTIQLILDGNYNSAYRMICKKNADSPFPSGINCDWEAWYYEGLDEMQLKASQNIMSSAKNDLISASALYCFYSGASAAHIADMFQKLYDYTPTEENDLAELIQYERFKISSDYNYESYIDAGLEEYQFAATFDLRTCPMCRKLDRKIFPLKDRIVGINFPPMHIGCRCTTLSTIGKEYRIESTRAALDPVTKERIIIPGTMNYQQWYDKYVKGNPIAEQNEKKEINFSSDSKQYKKYKEVLGKDAPETIVKFQDIKYGDPEKWGELKLNFEKKKYKY